MGLKKKKKESLCQQKLEDCWDCLQSSSKKRGKCQFPRLIRNPTSILREYVYILLGLNLGQKGKNQDDHSRGPTRNPSTSVKIDCIKLSLDLGESGCQSLDRTWNSTARPSLGSICLGQHSYSLHTGLSALGFLFYKSACFESLIPQHKVFRQVSFKHFPLFIRIWKTKQVQKWS